MEREEDYFRENRKEKKNQRKLASATDRSKYKKSDKEKYLGHLQQELEGKLGKKSLTEGRVVMILPQGIIVDANGEKIRCILKGLLKREKTEAKNLVAVGDFVLFERSSPCEGVIAKVNPRKTILSRADNLSRRKEQLIAVNVDQLIITAAVIEPSLKVPLIDRYIIAAQKGGLAPILVINKIDLLNHPEVDISGKITQAQSERARVAEIMEVYPKLGIPTIPISAFEGTGVERLRELMDKKTSVFSGQSGVGKSSLINAVCGSALRVGEMVDKTKKGSHTTTYTQLIHLESGGWCVDTPGIKSFGVWDLKREEIEGYFSEICLCGRECKFPDCTHLHEEKCAVQDALQQGTISSIRYDSYQALIESVEKQHQRR